MKILIAGGGTGGHLFPGLAIAKGFKDMNGGADIFFAGTERGIESRVLPKEGYPLKNIRVEPLAGHGLFKIFASLGRFPLALSDSLKILKETSPDIVIGLGGYSSGPLLIVASLKGIPTLILEQNVIPGVTNRILSKFVDAVAVNFKSSKEFFPERKTYITGNPIREGIASGRKEEGIITFGLEDGLFTILVFGGSAGAHTINKAMTGAIRYLIDLKDKIQIIHQTGDKDLDEIKEFYVSRDVKTAVLPFIERMAEAYAVSDLVVARAGAGTISEITACGKPSILVPYPYAAKNHQEVNAKILLDEGAAGLILDRELDGKRLASEIRFLIENPERLWRMEKASKRLGITDGTKKVVNISMNLVRRQKL